MKYTSPEIVLFNRNSIFLLFLSLFLLFTLFGATQSHARSLESPHATNDSGKGISLGTNFTQNTIDVDLKAEFTQLENLSDEGSSGSRHGLLESSNRKVVSKKDKKKKKKKKEKKTKKHKKSAANTLRGSPSLALLFSTCMLGVVALLAC